MIRGLARSHVVLAALVASLATGSHARADGFGLGRTRVEVVEARLVDEDRAVKATLKLCIRNKQQEIPTSASEAVVTLNVTLEADGVIYG